MPLLIQILFFIIGCIALLAAIFNWNWLFNSQNAEAIVRNVGRTKARLFYGCIGLACIGMAVYTFIETSNLN